MKNTKHHFIALDALRGLAALFVFLYHSPKLTFITNNSFINSSVIFVDLFFILSGFVIYHNYKNSFKTVDDTKRFIVKRFKRLYPLHLYTLMVLLLVEVFKLLTFDVLPYANVPFPENSLRGFFTNLFLLNSTPLFQGFSWNGVSWSISAESFCYILFVIVSLFFLKNKTTTFITSITVIVLCYFFFFFNYGDLGIIEHFNFSFLRAFIGFFLGVIIYLVRTYSSFDTKKYFNLFSVTEVVVLILLVIITSQLRIIKQHYYIYHILFAITILVFSYDGGIISRVFSKTIFQKLGLWSYSIYLNHIFIILIFKMLFLKLLKLEGDILLLIDILMIITTCLYSKYTYKYVEQKFYKSFRTAGSKLM
jgi:peptidoglycan/LPS O-acetylase OafA/YrhL